MEASGALAITLDTETFPVSDDEPSRFLWEWTGRIELVDPESDDTTRIGDFIVRYIDADGAANAGEPLFDVFDSHSAVVNYYPALYQGDWFRDGLAGFELSMDYGLSANLLILDRLLIYPAYRSRGVGLAALTALIRRFRLGAGLIAMKPFPLQFEYNPVNMGDDGFGLKDFRGNIRTATAKLKRYYATLGFKSVRKTEFMVLPPDARLSSRASRRRSSMSLATFCPRIS